MKKAILLFGILFLGLHMAEGQGCSDAGLCSVGNIKPGFSFSDKQNMQYVRYGVNYGKGDIGVKIYSTYIEYINTIKDNIDVGVKLSAQMANGYNITVWGFSDIYLYTIYYTLNRNLQLTTGVKIPLSRGNMKVNGLPLPMVYQPSLGTYDMLISLSYNMLNIFLISVGYQYPFIQNKNGFLRELYPSNSPLHSLWSTNGYIRKADLLFRLAVPIKFLQGKMELIPSILPIYHTGDDEFVNALGEHEIIYGSKGLTVNLNLFLNYSFLTSHRIQVGIGKPYITRHARPDGLTRHFVFDIEYRFQFTKKTN